jgi:hypothetical protein
VLDRLGRRQARRHIAAQDREQDTIGRGQGEQPAAHHLPRRWKDTERVQDGVRTGVSNDDGNQPGQHRTHAAT